MYKLPIEAREFVLFQRTELLPKRRKSLVTRLLNRIGRKHDDYNRWVRSIAADLSYDIESRYFSDMQKVAMNLKAHLPAHATRMLDLGCGMAALDLFLDHLISPDQIYLLDKTKTEDAVWYMFQEDGAFYNSLELAKEMLILNGVNPEKINLISAPDDGFIDLDSNSFDVVVSTLSWGFHYPIKLYIESVYRLLKITGVLFVDVRKDSGGYEELAKRFSVSIIGEEDKFSTVKCVKLAE